MTIECIRFKKYETGVLLGFCDLWVEKWGIEIRGCSVCTKNGHRWINLPSKEFQDDQGNKKWQNLVHFRDKSFAERFGAASLQAVDKWIQDHPEQEQHPDLAEPKRVTAPEDNGGGLPF